MGDQSLIRSVEQHDFDQWKIKWRDYNAFYKREGDTALSEEIVSATWHRFFDETEPVHCLIAELNGRLVGFVHYIFHRNTITIEPTCYLQDLFICKSTRGKGIAHALMLEFFDYAKHGGAKDVYWHTHATNETAKNLYDKVAIDTNFTVYRKTL